jgi:hypothetical protein
VGTEGAAKRRGFTTAEKWVIWGVFCLLVGLSSHITAFFGLLVLSVGIVILRNAVRSRRMPALLSGALMVLAGLMLTVFGSRVF